MAEEIMQIWQDVNITSYRNRNLRNPQPEIKQETKSFVSLIVIQQRACPPKIAQRRQTSEFQYKVKELDHSKISQVKQIGKILAALKRKY